METTADKRIAEEKRTVEAMVRIYCRGKHGNNKICENCRALLDYAFSRLERCPQVPSKPTCAKCLIHCYSPAMRERIRVVMRYSGPRMLFRHPLMAMRHIWRETIG
ncbi:MAG: nitrous oxide-stimulated promoter family protein [Muribaculaceae bacterium]|nr:nitrous oxide-stimulated promoter family protein [Muribaculaceae bacterium]